MRFLLYLQGGANRSFPDAVRLWPLGSVWTYTIPLIKWTLHIAVTCKQIAADNSGERRKN